jgi:hypothetical protein
MGNDRGNAKQLKAWFEEVGARGFPFSGAVLGLTVSLMIVIATAQSAPNRRGERRDDKGTHAQKSEAVEGKPSSTSMRR